MGWLLDELKNLAGSDAEGRVKAAAKRARQRHEPTLRELTRLRLKITDADNAGVGIEIDPGLPDHLREASLKPEERIAFLLSLRTGDLSVLIRSANRLNQVLARAARSDGDEWKTRVQHYTKTFAEARDAAIELQKEAADAALLKRFLEYDEDTLGLYDYSRAPSCTIKLYWAVIGAFAQKLDCSLEALTAVTVIHELAHAYTHLGADAQGERWDTDHFSNTPSVVKEGLAQYYTHLLARELYHAGDKDIFIAYRRFLRLQSGPYLVHRKWIFPDRVSPEAMRAAVLEFRRGNILTPSYFEYLSNKAGGRLGLYMNMRRSR